MFKTSSSNPNATASSSRLVIPNPSVQIQGSGSTPTSPTSIASASTTRATIGGPRTRDPAAVTGQGQGPRNGMMATMIGRMTGSTKAAAAQAAAEAAAAAKAEDLADRRTFDRAVATIDCGAMRRNFRRGMAMIAAGMHPDLSGDFPYGPGEKRNDETHPAKWTPGVRPAAVVKASGYGLDDEHQEDVEAAKIALTLLSEGCRDFFVASAGEAADLRAALKAQRPDLEKGVAINMLDGIAKGERLPYLIRHKITPVLNSPAEVKLWNDAGAEAGRTLPAILQFNSGMTRAGIRDRDVAALAKDLAEGKYPNIDVKLVMSHLSDSDIAQPLEGSTLYEHVAGHKTQDQLKKFNKICELFPNAEQSIGASSTVFLGKELHKDMVRMGATFHGQAPFGGEDHPLEPTLTIKAKIRQVDVAEVGEEIGYGSNYTVKDQPELHGAVAWGYTEGTPRRSNGNKPGDPARPHVLVGGAKAELIGSTSMDQSQVKFDVDGTPEDLRQPGKMVTVLGEGISVNQFSKMHGSGVSELSVKLGSRVHKEYLDDDAPSVVGEAYVDPSPHAWKD